MTERQKLNRLTKQIKAEHPDIFWYKIPDTYGGQKKPFDVFACIEGRAVAIEFKNEKGVLSGNQGFALLNVMEAGGLGLVGVFKKDRLDFFPAVPTMTPFCTAEKVKGGWDLVSFFYEVNWFFQRPTSD